MKPQNKIMAKPLCSALALVSTLACLAFPITANAIDKTGNGGDIYAGEFYMTSQNFVAALEKLGQDKVGPSVDLKRLRAAIDTMEPHSTEEDIKGKDGKPRDAINDPATHQVYFRIDKWLSTDSKPELVAISAHEPMTLAGLETSDNYMLTYKMIRTLQDAGIGIDTLFDRTAFQPLNLTGTWACQDEDTKTLHEMRVETLTNNTYSFSTKDIEGQFAGPATRDTVGQPRPVSYSFYQKSWRGSADAKILSPSKFKLNTSVNDSQGDNLNKLSLTCRPKGDWKPTPAVGEYAEDIESKTQYDTFSGVGLGGGFAQTDSTGNGYFAGSAHSDQVIFATDKAKTPLAVHLSEEGKLGVDQHGLPVYHVRLSAAAASNYFLAGWVAIEAEKFGAFTAKSAHFAWAPRHVVQINNKSYVMVSVGIGSAVNDNGSSNSPVQAEISAHAAILVRYAKFVLTVEYTSDSDWHGTSVDDVRAALQIPLDMIFPNSQIRFESQYKHYYNNTQPPMSNFNAGGYYEVKF